MGMGYLVLYSRHLTIRIKVLRETNVYSLLKKDDCAVENPIFARSEGR